ncbi:hypothetical protein F5148DRAFT_1378269 [Russula earlei]|nr:hypothetical protein F5148DRAFT_1378269 [Russula earlei]
MASLPDSFLGGGSAPLLEQLALKNCAFPGIPKFLLSANHLVGFSLRNIPDSGYFSPQALVTALSVMSRLVILRVDFQSPRYPSSRPRPPLTRTVLPALTDLLFQGVHEYLEDLLAQIEAPLLNTLYITFFMDLDFVVPQLHQLISRTEWFKTCDRAFVCIAHPLVRFSIFRGTNWSPELSLDFSCRELDYQLSSLAQVFNSSLLLLSTLAELDIEDDVLPHSQTHWKGDMDPAQWLELLDPFIAVKVLRLSDQVGPHVCQALEELAEERVTEVLPALQKIFLRDRPLKPVPKYIERFVAARRLSGHPVVVYPW